MANAWLNELELMKRFSLRLMLKCGFLMYFARPPGASVVFQFNNSPERTVGFWTFYQFIKEDVCCAWGEQANPGSPSMQVS